MVDWPCLSPSPPTAAAGAPLVAVVVVDWNGLRDTIECVRSVLAQTWPRLEVHLVDNGSARGESERLAAEFGGRVRLTRNEQNLGFAGGCNGPMRAILDEGAARYVALLNNDARAAPDWLARLVAAAEAHPGAGMLASHMVFAADPERTENAGIWILTTGEAVPRGRGRPRAAFGAPALLLGACGGAVLYRADVLRELGVFRADFFANFEDVDLSLRLAAAGWFARFVPGAIVHHRLNATVARVRDDEFRVRSVRNMTLAYWCNMPRTVILLDLPALFVSWVLVPLVAPLLGQYDLARVLVRGRLRALAEWRAIGRRRRWLRARRRGNPLRIWWLQRSWLRSYFGLLRALVWRRERRYLE